MKRLVLIAGIVVVALLLLWRFGLVGNEAPSARGNNQRSENSSSKPTSPLETANESPRLTPPERSPLADNLNSPATDIRADLRLVADILDTFRTNFLQTGNPVGSNAEITAALTGRNKLRLSLIPIDHPAINQAGELCDRWGTPFFFHSESATKMEIRSAGPDKKMWTSDDVMLSP